MDLYHCLCFLFLLTTFKSSSAQSINVTITGGPSSPATLGASTTYVLTCTAGPNPINVTWITPPAGTVGTQTTSGSSSSRTLTLPSPVQLSYAGLYVCNASANGVTRTISYAFNVSVDNPSIYVDVPQSGTVGTPLLVNCLVTLSGTVDKALDVRWVGPTGFVSSTGRIAMGNVSTTSALGYTFNSVVLRFSTLSSQDNSAMYQCWVRTLYTPYGMASQSPPLTSSATIMVNALVLTPTISSGTCQQGVLQLNCTADRPLSVVPPLMFSWFRSGVRSGTFSPLDPGVPGINVSRTHSGSNTSTLSISGSSVSVSYVYQCMALVAVPDDVPVVANITTGVVSFSISGVVSRLTLQYYGQLSRIVWEAPVVNCNMVSYYTVAMTTYSGGTLIEMGTTTGQNYTLKKNYTAGVPYNVTVWALFGTVAGGNTSQTIFTQELAPSSPLSVKTTSMNGSTILVSWNPLSPVEARGFVRYYLVTWTPSKARGSPGSANLTADITMYLITDLDPMVSYTISVTPGTSAGVGTASNTTVVTPVSTQASQPSSPVPSSPVPTSPICGTSYMICAIPIAVVVSLVTFGAIVAISIVLVKLYRCKNTREAIFSDTASIALNYMTKPNNSAHLKEIAEVSENGEINIRGIV